MQCSIHHIFSILYTLLCAVLSSTHLIFKAKQYKNANIANFVYYEKTRVWTWFHKVCNHVCHHNKRNISVENRSDYANDYRLFIKFIFRIPKTYQNYTFSETTIANVASCRWHHRRWMILKPMSSRLSGHLFTARKRSSGKVMFLHLSVILFTRVSAQGSPYPGGSLSRGSLYPGRSLSRGVSVQGVSIQGVSVQWGRSQGRGVSIQGGSLSRGVSVQGSLSGRPPHKNGRYALYWNAFLFYNLIRLLLLSRSRTIR